MLYTYVTRHCQVCGHLIMVKRTFNEVTDRWVEADHECRACQGWASVELLAAHINANLKQERGTPCHV